MSSLDLAPTFFRPATPAAEPPFSARNLDKFYTEPSVVRQCLFDFEQWTGICLDATDTDIIEPSAGAGAFLNHLPPRTLSYDLAPEDSRILRQDFLHLHRDAPAIVIGNPPFGKASRLAVRFFNHSAAFASHIAFILPRTFEKASIQNRLDRRFHLVCERVLSPQSFTFMGQPYAVPCVFQVWECRADLRPHFDLPRTHPDFDFVTREEADFAFQRVGVRAGEIKTNFASVAAASHHFLRARVNADAVMARFQDIDFSAVKARTAGNPSISKTELVALYSEHGSVR